jgi:hypothetical protein
MRVKDIGVLLDSKLYFHAYVEFVFFFQSLKVLVRFVTFVILRLLIAL